MSLEYIYVARHGFRSNWLVNPATGDYTAVVRSPTGIAADPPLTAHGVDQARELAAFLARLLPAASEHGPMAKEQPAGPATGARRSEAEPVLPVERIYCSPYYRCLQTVQPLVEMLAQRAPDGSAEETTVRNKSAPPQPQPPWWAAVRCEPGLVDWFGPAPFPHPQPAPVPQLRARFFPWIDPAYEGSGAAPPRHGESMAQLHARVAAAAAHIVRQCDAEGVRAVLLCSHAATIIALGRVLTGQLPDDVATEDFGAFTCGLSVYRRRRPQGQQQQQRPAPKGRDSPHSQRQHEQDEQHGQQQQQRQPAQDPHIPVRVPPWDDQFHTLASQTWTGGRGIGGGWDCTVNCDCSFLSGREERGWRFSGDDESFVGVTRHAGPIVDAGLELGVVVEKRSAGRAQQGADDGGVGGAGCSGAKTSPRL
ncbi:phosphoglycerate mutase family protein [Niveomyces insectorum RCEF 264]|uniref:Phosphoglycerate mutase family protein n=1 Tax=Niveomyces insectorum RCEF 264 TaxID=1081102 RepID=A0A167RGQ6_9HYPO|nr:phosphoglycerate mutase family protein [Niveomyces insectorum RCEF 264]